MTQTFIQKLESLKAAIRQVWNLQIQIVESDEFYSDGFDMSEYDQLCDVHGVLQARVESLIHSDK